MIVWLWLACATAPVEPPPDDPWPLRDVELTVGAGAAPLVVEARGATVDGDGAGAAIDVRATVPGPPPLVVTGDRSTFRMRDGVVVFEQNVVAKRAEVTIHCARLEVTYQGDRVERAVATGEVRVTRGERVARGQTATLTVADGRVELTGAPSVTDGPNQLTGERIVLFLDEERVECDRCRLEVAGDAVVPGR